MRKGKHTMKIILLAALILALSITSTSASETSPVGKTLPSVKGEALSRTAVRFPEDTAGAPAILMVAYRRGTQADVNRWTAFLQERAPRTVRYEVPTIANIFWRPMAGWIDSGMRGGVPQEAWSSVVTLYTDAPKLRDFLGDYGGTTTHVVLLDREGRVAWFNAGGFSERAGASLLEALQALSGEASK
jgi:hypothetical protein